MNKLIIIAILSASLIFFSGCIENVETSDSTELPTTTINTYPVYSVIPEGANFWVLYNDNGSRFC